MSQQPYLAPRRLETDRLVLRAFTPADHEPYAQLTADAGVMQYIGVGTPNTPDMAWRMLSAFLGHWEMRGYGMWGVTLKAGGALIGHAGFIDPPGWPGFEIGYLLGRDHWGQGYALEAVRAVHRVAFEDLKRERVISLIRPGNEPSKRLVRKLGAQHEGSVELLGSEAELFVHRPAG